MSDKKNNKTIAWLFLIALLVVVKVFGLPSINKNTTYYQNFISYVMGKKSLGAYQAYFDKNTPADYEMTRFIKPKLTENDSVFVWGNNAQLYQLLGVVPPTKYVVAYHISNYSDGLSNTKQMLELTKPKFIVIMANSNPIPFPLNGYFKKIDINRNIIYEKYF